MGRKKKKKKELEKDKKREDNIIKDVENLLRLKKKQITTQLKVQEIFLDLKMKMKQSKTIIRDIRDLFKQKKEDYYKPVIILNMKATEIEIKHYHLKNISIKIDDI